MKNRKLICLVSGWFLVTILIYYCFPYFVIPFVWLFTATYLFILLIFQIVKTYRERKNISKPRQIRLITITILFFLTFYRFNKIPTDVIEKIDCFILKNKREQIVNQVKSGELKPNISWNNIICELPFEFPIISNGGNDIMIYKNKKTKKITIHFWIFRNFFDSPQTYLVYSEDSENITYYEKKIKENPDQNWKLKPKWYRILDY
jgi:energy-coupling factor transporter transmembrane protein EcfT